MDSMLKCECCTDATTQTIEGLSETVELYFVRPEVALDESTIRSLIVAGVDPLVARIDLEAPKLLLVAHNNWSSQRAAVAEREYKRFLSLQLWNRVLPHPLVPTVLVDTIWHAHILDTRAYVSDMERLFGGYLHHFPYLGFRGPDSIKRKKHAFVRTCELYEWTFGESYLRSVMMLRGQCK